MGATEEVHFGHTFYSSLDDLEKDIIITPEKRKELEQTGFIVFYDNDSSGWDAILRITNGQFPEQDIKFHNKNYGHKVSMCQSRNGFIYRNTAQHRQSAPIDREYSKVCQKKSLDSFHKCVEMLK